MSPVEMVTGVEGICLSPGQPLFPQSSPAMPPRCKVGEGPWHTLPGHYLLLTMDHGSAMRGQYHRLVQLSQTVTAACVQPWAVLPIATAAPSAAPLVATKPTAS